MDRFNLAEFVVTALGRDQGVHIDYVTFLIELIERSPGLQEILASLSTEDRWVGSDALFEKFLRGSPGLAARIDRARSG